MMKHVVLPSEIWVQNPEIWPDFAKSDLTLALSCVVEGRDGSKSFWALNHPPDKPDFHHDDCFQLQIGAALRP